MRPVKILIRLCECTGRSDSSITKICLILQILPPKNENFQKKKSDIFHISAQNIDCRYALEPNEYPQSMFLSRNKKNNVYPCKSHFYCIKWCLRGQHYINVFSWGLGTYVRRYVLYHCMLFCTHIIKLQNIYSLKDALLKTYYSECYLIINFSCQAYLISLLQTIWYLCAIPITCTCIWHSGCIDQTMQ